MPVGHCRGDHVDPLVDPVAPHDLRPEDRPVIRIEDQLCGHAGRTRIIGGVIEGVRVNGPIGAAGSPQAPLIPADRRRHHVEYLDDRSPERSNGMRRPSGDVVCHPAALAIGHVGEGDERRRMRDGVWLLDGIADGVDVGIGCLVRLR